MKDLRKKHNRASSSRPAGTSKTRITAMDAKRRAERHLANRIFKALTVVEGDGARRWTYGLSRRDVWVVQFDSFPARLAPSQIVLVCKRTGRILYDGLACD